MGDPVVTGIESYYVVQTGYEYTSTQSIFTLDVAGQVEMTVTFLSPVLPDTIMEMSLPYSYMDVAIRSLDGNTHDVQLYTDITAGESLASHQSFEHMLKSHRMGRWGPQPYCSVELWYHSIQPAAKTSTTACLAYPGTSNTSHLDLRYEHGVFVLSCSNPRPASYAPARSRNASPWSAATSA